MNRENLERYKWYDSQLKWHSAQRPSKWHKSQIKWYGKATTRVPGAYTLLVTKTLLRHRRKLIANITAHNALLKHLKRRQHHAKEM